MTQKPQNPKGNCWKMEPKVMEKYHELTERIIGLESSDADSEIRKWLEERAKELSSKPHSHLYAKQILGLTDVWEKPCHRGCKSGECFHLNPKQKQSWCEHHYYDDGNDYFQKGPLRVGPMYCANYCAFCGTPRPTPKPLVERLADELEHEIRMFNDDQPYVEQARTVAQAALDFLREHKGEL